MNISDEEIASYRPKMYEVALIICGNAADADDATQEAILKAMKKKDQFRYGNITDWLMRIVKTSCIDGFRYYRVRRAHGTEVLKEIIAPIQAEPSSGKIPPKMAEFVNSLPSKDLQVMQLISDNWPYREAAKEIGMNFSYLKTKVRRTRMRAAKHIGEQYAFGRTG